MPIDDWSSVRETVNENTRHSKPTMQLRVLVKDGIEVLQQRYEVRVIGLNEHDTCYEWYDIPVVYHSIHNTMHVAQDKIQEEVQIKEAARYVIWSNEHEAWWAKHSMGYTTDLKKAGLYTETIAFNICNSANYAMLNQSTTRKPDELPVCIDSFPEDIANDIKKFNHR